MEICPICNAYLDNYNNVERNCISCNFTYSNYRTAFSIKLNEQKYSIFIGSNYTYLYFGGFDYYSKVFTFAFGSKIPQSKLEAANLISKLIKLKIFT